MRKIISTVLVLSLVLQGLSIVSFGSSAKVDWVTYNKATALSAKGKYTEAIPLYKASLNGFIAVGNNTNTAMVYNKLGKAYAESNQYDNAVMTWNTEAKYWSLAGKKQETIAAQRKASLIRQEIRIFSKVSVDKDLQPPKEFIPYTGTYFGLYAEKDSAFNRNNADYALNAESVLGKKPTGYLLYYTYGMDFSDLAIHVENCKKTGSFLMLGIQPMQGLSTVKDDAYLEDLARDIASFDIPVLVRFANEMNEPSNKIWYYEDPTLFIEKFRLVADKMHELAPNALMMWGPAWFPPDNIQKYYPGDSYVDWVGVSMYRQFRPELDPLGKGIDRSKFTDQFAYFYSLYGNRKPLMISEGAVSYKDQRTGNDVTEFAVKELNDYLTYMPILYPNLKAIMYFSSTTSSKPTAYRLSDNSRILATFKQGIAKDDYVAEIGDSSGLLYKEITKDYPRIDANTVSIVSHIKVADNNCAYVKYFVNGKEVAKVTSIPYEVDLTSALSGTSEKAIEVKAYDRGGKLLTSKKVTVK